MNVSQLTGALALTALVATAGCKSASAPTPENFTKGIAKYLVDHPDCLYQTALRFPYETSNMAEIKQLDTLVNSKLLNHETEPAIHVTRYTVSDYGQKSAPRFCYGFRHIAGIDSSTPPAKGADGFIESKVTYHYTLEDVPVWAKSADVQKAYPEAAKNINSPSPAALILAQTGVGWQVPE